MVIVPKYPSINSQTHSSPNHQSQDDPPVVRPVTSSDDNDGLLSSENDWLLLWSGEVQMILESIDSVEHIPTPPSQGIQ